MKKLYLLTKVEFHFTTAIYFLLSFFAGLFKQTLTVFFIVLFHELAHTLTAYCFNFRINKIKILPFGAFLELDDYGVHHVLEELCVVLAGPLSHIILNAIFVYLYNQKFISLHHYEYCLLMSQSILFFNLLPIYPLDGAKIIMLLFSYILDYLVVLKIVLVCSIVSLFYFFYIYFDLEYFIVFSFLIFMVYQYYRDYYLFYHRLLISRLSSCQYKHRKIQKKFKFHRPYHNFYVLNNYFIDEKDFIKRNMLKSELRK
jgi:Peptidase family M50.